VAGGVLGDVDHAPLVRAEADRPLPFANFDVEAQLAAVEDLTQTGV
jgi:hypothetical protein